MEKKPDHIKRARNYQKNEHVLKKMREKVYFRNPDEFDFRMNNSTMSGGKHVMQDSSDDEEVTKMRKNKDINLVSARLQHERKKANRLHKELHFIDHNEESGKGYDELV